MNYLSHFVIDHIEGDHEYNTGLVLPDFCKKWIKNFHKTEELSSQQQRLLAGAMQHYQSDKAFHTSIFFQRYSKIFTDLFAHSSLSNAVQRKWFLAHVAFELMIDRMIVKHYPGFVKSFYDALTLVKDDVLMEFLENQGMKNIDEFFTFFNHFRDVKYIYYYTDNNKFVYSLNRIMMRVGLPEMNDADKQILTDILLNIENTYFAEYGHIMTELKAVFAAQ